MTDTKPTVFTDGGVSFDQAMEIHQMFNEDCLTASQIALVTKISLQMVAGVLSGRHFPGALKQWESKK